MSDKNKPRNIAMEESFIHTNPGPKTEPPFSALRVPETGQPAQIQPSQTSNPNNRNYVSKSASG